MTVAEFAAQWPGLSTGRSAATVAHNTDMTSGFTRAHAGRLLGSVTAVEAQQWAAGHGGQVRYLRLMFADAARLGLCAENPFLAVRGGATGTLDRTPPSTSELARISAEADPLFREFVTCAAYTGLRLSELAAMQAEDVIEVPSLRIVVRHGKGGRTGDVVAVLGEAEDVIRDLCVRRVGRLFWTKTGREWSRALVSQHWRACAGDFAGSFHTLRHFHATWLIDRGASYQDAAVQLRHFDGEGRPNIGLIASRYGHPDPAVALARLEALS